MQWALSAVVRGNGLAESTVAGWLTHSDAILVIWKVSPKKAAVLLDIVQMRGGGEGPAQIFRTLFTNCILGQFGVGDGEGETPAQFFWYIGVQKKWYKLSKLGGGGGR